jgi:uncharacterized protein (TIGR02001 family)
MKNISKVFALLICAMMVPLSVANAKSGLNFSGQFSAATDGIYRGTTQTEGKPQYVGYVQVAYDKYYTGLRFKSMEDRTSGVDSQTNYVFGYKDKYKDVSYNIYAAYKQYENVKPITTDNEFWEYQIDLSKPITNKLKGKLTFSYSPDGYGKIKEFYYSEIGADYSFSKNLTFISTLGYRDAIGSSNYSNYMIGLSYNFGKNDTLSLRYSDTNREKELGSKYSDSTYLLLVHKF